MAKGSRSERQVKRTESIQPGLRGPPTEGPLPLRRRTDHHVPSGFIRQPVVDEQGRPVGDLLVPREFLTDDGTVEVDQPAGDATMAEARAVHRQVGQVLAFGKCSARQRAAICEAHRSLLGYTPELAWHDALMTQLLNRAWLFHQGAPYKGNALKTEDEGATHITPERLIESMRGRAALYGLKPPAYVMDVALVRWLAARYGLGGGGPTRTIKSTTIAKLVLSPAKLAAAINRDVNRMIKTDKTKGARALQVLAKRLLRSVRKL